jgi:phosphate transport system substrate-binding protein
MMAGLRRLAAALLALTCIGAPVNASETARIEPPPRASPRGVLRIAGNPALSEIAARWREAFMHAHPGIEVELDLRGSDIAFASLYTGQADVALLGRMATESELKAYEWIYLAPPVSLEVLLGSLDRAGRSPALTVFVHRDNPLPSISLGQLERMFAATPLAAGGPLRYWGGVGLADSWAHAPIRLYGPDAESGTGRFFRASVLHGTTRQRWEALREFDEPVLPRGRRDDAGARTLAALAQDSHGIAIADLQQVPPEVRVLPLAGANGPIAPGVDSLRSGAYPLGRQVRAYVHAPSAGRIDEETSAFLAHVLSDEGQSAAKPLDGYLPLGAARAADQRKLLAAWQ